MLTGKQGRGGGGGGGGGGVRGASALKKKMNSKDIKVFLSRLWTNKYRIVS